MSAAPATGVSDAAPAAPRALPAVVLRRPEAADEREFLALVRRSRRLHAGWVEAPDDSLGYWRYLARAAGEDDDLPTHRCRLVCRPEDGAIVGVVNCNQVVWGALRSGTLGYYAFATTAGRGYLRSGVARMLVELFDEWELHRVEAAVQPENLRSRALLATLGFRLEGFSPRYLRLRGRWRDHERWALLVDEWRERGRPGRRGATRRAAPRRAATRQATTR
jgi:ribosomal-protein-alanine N-acetyltransferase